MKKIIAFGLAICIATGLQAQKSTDVKTADVPEAVRTAFQKQYPDAAGADWEMKEEKYKVEFRQSGTKHMAGFDNTGTLVSHGMEIKVADVPAAVSEAIMKDHPGSKIDDAYRVEKDGKTMYKLELDGKPDKKVIYTADGVMVKERKD